MYIYRGYTRQCFLPLIKPPNIHIQRHFWHVQDPMDWTFMYNLALHAGPNPGFCDLLGSRHCRRACVLPTLHALIVYIYV